jgi:hypothetical protein
MTKGSDPTRQPDDDHDRALQRLEKALKEALTRSQAAESVLEDQRRRIKTLGDGHEASTRALDEARAELRRVMRERDELRAKLSRVDSVQTATIALPDDDPSLPPAAIAVPSLDELMTGLGEIEGPNESPEGVHGDRSEEMIAPALVFPEEFADMAETAALEGPVTRMLVLLDPERPMKYPLFKETMTIGRADSADIQIDNGFLSRLHARIVSTADGVLIEDVESKNGIRVNMKVVARQALRHGDVVDLGRLRFRFIDTAAADAD